jgi:hypothetical protein
MNISDFRPLDKFHVNRGMSIHTIKFALKNYHWDFDVYLPSKGCNLQRPLVWTLQQKQEFIKSVLKGIPLPVVTVIQTKNDKMEVIDGKQRLTTLISFVNGEFPIIHNNQEYFYKDLPETFQAQLDRFGDLKFDIYYPPYTTDTFSDEQKITMFEYLNFTGTPQDQEHLNKLKQ